MRGSPWADTYRQNRLDSNKQKRKSLPGPGSPVWDEIHRKKHTSISPLSLLLYAHITFQTRWPVYPLGPAPAPGSCIRNGEKWKPVHVNWQHISARQDRKWLQQQLPVEAFLIANKEENFVFICAPLQTKLTKEHLESRSCTSHLRYRKKQTIPCLSRLFRRNISNCDFDFHSWGAASPLQDGALLKTGTGSRKKPL